MPAERCLACRRQIRMPGPHGVDRWTNRGGTGAKRAGLGAKFRTLNLPHADPGWAIPILSRLAERPAFFAPELYCYQFVGVHTDVISRGIHLLAVDPIFAPRKPASVLRVYQGIPDIFLRSC